MSNITASPPGRGSNLATRRSLIENLSNPEAGTRWAEFDRVYRDVVLSIAVSAGLRHHDAEDITQDVFFELARRLTGFKLRDRPGSFRAYLRKLVNWRSTNRLNRNRRTEAVSLDAEGAPEIASEPEPDLPDYENAVIGAMKAMSRDLSLQDLQILELVYCSGWSTEEVAKALQVKRGHVYTIKNRHHERLGREIRRRLAEDI